MLRLDLPGGEVECRLIDGDPDREPLMFLHEGLGCAAMWSRFPDMVAKETGRSALVYSRHGHGGSAPSTTARSTSYLHDEADHVLPEVLARLSLRRPVLIGHSDGASIALLAAGRLPAAAVVAIAPHVFVEPETLGGIAKACCRFRSGGLAEKLAVFHDDSDTVFRSWSEVWLSPQFADWNIEDRLRDISCPVLLVQGTQDEYGTLGQLDAIARGVNGPIRRAELAGCGHSPHLEQAATTQDIVVRFLRTSSELEHRSPRSGLPT